MCNGRWRVGGGACGGVGVWYVSGLCSVVFPVSFGVVFVLLPTLTLSLSEPDSC